MFDDSTLDECRERLKACAQVEQACRAYAQRAQEFGNQFEGKSTENNPVVPIQANQSATSVMCYESIANPSGVTQIRPMKVT